MAAPDYSKKDVSYFSHTRREIAPLLPTECVRVLEVGCGNGSTLHWLKQRFPRIETVGLEYDASNADRLRSNVDSFHICNAETFDTEIGTFDLMLFLDVLEHLRSPEDVLRRYARLLRKGGTVIVSVPAVSYIGVSLPLLIKRRFTYSDDGILDRTHTRLFVEETSIKLLNDADLIVDAGLLAGIEGPRSRALNIATLGFFRHYLTKQYIVRGRAAVGRHQTIVDWKIARY